MEININLLSRDTIFAICKDQFAFIDGTESKRVSGEIQKIINYVIDERQIDAETLVPACLLSFIIEKAIRDIKESR